MMEDAQQQHTKRQDPHKRHSVRRIMHDSEVLAMWGVSVAVDAVSCIILQGQWQAPRSADQLARGAAVAHGLAHVAVEGQG